MPRPRRRVRQPGRFAAPCPAVTSGRVGSARGSSKRRGRPKGRCGVPAQASGSSSNTVAGVPVNAPVDPSDASSSATGAPAASTSGLQLMTTTSPSDVEHGRQAGWGGESLSAALPPPVPVVPLVAFTGESCTDAGGPSCVSGGGGDAAVSTGGSNTTCNSSSSFTTGGGIAVTRPEVPLAIPSMRPGTSLGCVVPLATKERIWRGEFVDFAQLYPENASTAMAHAHRGGGRK